MRRARRAIVMSGIVVAVVVGIAAPAGAHAALVETTPVSGQSVDAVDEITLVFTEPVSITLGGVRLYDERGRLVDVGAFDLLADGTVVHAETPDLTDGSYVVTWRVVSDDQHPVQGAFTFVVGAGGADVSGLATRLLASQGSSVAVGVADAVVRFLTYIFLLLAAGPLVFASFCLVSAFEARSVRLLAWIGWTGLLATTIVGFFVRAPYASGLPFGDALDGDVLGDLLDTRFGAMTMLRIGLLVVAAPLLALAIRGRRPARLALAAVGVAVVATISATGHAAVGAQAAIAFPADVAHLGAMATWLGGLTVLAIYALRGLSTDEAVAVSRRFSRLALVAVAVLVGTGTYQSWRLVRSFDGLGNTDYGRLLIAKLVLVGVVVFVASMSREIVRKRFVEPPADVADRSPNDVAVGARLPVGPGAKLADDLDDRRVGLSTLRRSVAVELAVAVVILGVSSVLVSAEPAVDAREQAYSEVVEADGVDFDVLVTPGAPGRNDVHVQALDPNGTLTDLADMQIWVSEESRDIALIEVPLRRLGPGHYFSPGFDFPFAGEWRIDIRGFRSETDYVDAATTFDL